MVLRLLFNLLLINCPAINIIASTYLKRNGRKWQPLSSSTLSTKDCIEKEGQKWRRRTCQTVIMCKAILIDMMLNSYFSLGNYFSIISIFTLAILLNRVNIELVKNYSNILTTNLFSEMFVFWDSLKYSFIVHTDWCSDVL